jgi:hypothetical protein
MLKWLHTEEGLLLDSLLLPQLLNMCKVISTSYPGQNQLLSRPTDFKLHQSQLSLTQVHARVWNFWRYLTTWGLCLHSDWTSLRTGGCFIYITIIQQNSNELGMYHLNLCHIFSFHNLDLLINHRRRVMHVWQRVVKIRQQRMYVSQQTFLCRSGVVACLCL